MVRELFLVQETAGARLYRLPGGREVWIPRSVCNRTMKFPSTNGMPRHEVDIEDWWWEKKFGEKAEG